MGHPGSDVVASAWGGTVHETSPVRDDSVPHGPPAQSGTSLNGAAAPDTQRLREAAQSAEQLLANVGRVTAEEFHWQESHYDRDSRRGRELLFLIANHEWVRATSEIIDLSRADAFDTTIKIDIDLDQVTHEAFRQRTGTFWAPIITLPPQPGAATQPASGRRRLEPDPFATVTTAAGDLLPLLPTADVRHQTSAAMAEIIVNMGVARWPDADGEPPAATRDQRLLLSAVIYRSLHRGSTAGGPAPGAPGAGSGNSRAGPGTPAAEPGISPSASRLDKARKELARLLGRYKRMLDDAVREAPRPGTARSPDPGGPQFAPELARRAVDVLRALADSVLVVVPIDRGTPPTVLTVKVPTRGLASPAVSKIRQPSTWMLRPLGHLAIDLLLPTADADRQVELHLPDGVSFEQSPPAGAAEPARAAEPSLPRMDIDVRPPEPLRDLAKLMDQILDPKQQQRPLPVKRCLVDLARSKVASVRETLRQYDVTSLNGARLVSAEGRRAATAQARDTLAALYLALSQPCTTAGAPVPGLAETWRRFQRETHDLCRRTSAERPSPHILVARAEMVEDVYQRATPSEARIYGNIAIADGEYFSIARFSGRMSLLLMTVVLAFLAVSKVTKIGAILSPEVLAIVLTLFSAIQAGQMEARDRSTIHGLLSAAGNWLIAASILPAVILAVALAFSKGGWAPTIWAVVSVGLQLLFQLAMWRGPLTPAGSPRTKQRRSFSTEGPNYHCFEALRSDYWRSTTADALTIGRSAYAYVIWQNRDSGQVTPQLKPVLSWKSEFPVPGQLANVLALLRAGTFGQAMTFAVFRQEPDKEWLGNATVARPDFDPDRLAPMESITSVVDVFVGVPRDKTLAISCHPVADILNAAARKLIVLDAQLPVPAPVGGYGNRLWARVRVGLRNTEDIERLAPFLDDVYAHTAPPAGGDQPYVVAVQAAQTADPRVITGRAEFRPAEPGLVLASDLDITYPIANGDEDADAHTWRLLTFTSDARSNVESEILNKLSELSWSSRCGDELFAAVS